MTFPSPSRDEILAALTAHGVNFVVEPLKAQSEGRPWQYGLRAIVDHHTAGTNSLGYLMNAGGAMPFVNTLISRDGVVHVLSTRSVWGSGAGGPWPGVAAKDSLHLVGWQNEVEDLGITQTFTAAQMESLGRVNAALVSLGVPAHNEVNHRDWTDGTGPVGGYPLPTNGRKDDTKYDWNVLQANTAKYIGGDTVALTPEDIQAVAAQAAHTVWNTIYADPIDSGKPASTASILLRARMDANAASKIQPGTPGAVSLSDADVDRIAARTADLLAARLAQ